MKAVYEITTKYTGNSGTSRNFSSYTTTAKNMKEAIKKTESYLKKTNAGAERVDEVRLVCEISF